MVIGVVGVRLTRVADQLADKTGLGEAVTGALFLGGITSLPGIVTSVTAAATGHPELSISNALGGITAQTAFLALADIVYTKANLEHAAASVANLSQGTLLVSLLALPLLAASSPPVSIGGVHPVSVVLPIAYLLGLRLISQARAAPMWAPTRTPETRMDEPVPLPEMRVSFRELWLRLAIFALMIGTAGYVVAQAGVAIAQQTGLSETAVGGLFTAISTSLPELVTSVAAVRQGALTLAVGDIVGGNSFDVLFIAFADIAYRSGSIYHALTPSQTFVIALTILMTGVLLLGLLRREKYGIGNIGFESVLILILYLGGLLVLFL
ncbi:Inner membrane protein YrbG [Halomicronema hongdechloris C2206]|uniref:Inner membrane protein YrbG n=2 Tax=Halomicronema hongdechloris TaxID=1209493 RepID=A0A1Z3HGD3_9CYAN|nr:Inner membrane protein YrbG [Halomicronema hongdechloris C2206]